MKPWRSLEFRLTAWYAAMLFVGFLALSLVLWMAVRYAVRAAVDDRLQQRIERLIVVVSMEIEEELDEEPDGEDEELHAEVEEELVDYVLALPEGRLTQIRDEVGKQVFPPDGADLPQISWRRGGPEPFLYSTHVASVSHRVLIKEVTLAGKSYAFLLASSLESLSAIRARMLMSLLVAAPAVLLLSCGGGFYIARKALSPVNEISETAATISVGNLSTRITVLETGDALERLSRAFNAMLDRIESSVSKIEQFSADASHELRTPISVIRTTAELAVRHGRTEEEYLSDLRDIEAEANRLTELIEVLLSLSREGAESRPVSMSDVDLSPLVVEVCHQFDREVDSKGIGLEVTVLEGVTTVTGNEPSLRRMLASLLENAVAHTHEGQVAVSLHQDSDGIRLNVKDTGEGIPEEAIGRVFDRLYRVDSSRTREGGNLGLGLSIAKRIAELHGAELSARSRLGEGTTFSVLFQPNRRL